MPGIMSGLCMPDVREASARSNAQTVPRGALFVWELGVDAGHYVLATYAVRVVAVPHPRYRT